MVKKFLQGAGLVALVLWTGAGFAALAVVKDRVQITVEAAEPSQGSPDPVSLLRDKVELVHADLQALAGALPGSFEALAEAQSSQSEERYRQLAASVRDLRIAVGHLAEAQRAAEERLLAAAAAPMTEVAEEITETIEVAEVAPEPAPREEPEEPATEPPAEPEPAPERPRPSFLAFSLPSQSFAFDAEQKLTLIPRLSRVGFDAKSTLHDFSGVTSALQGTLVTNLANPAAKCTGSVKCAAGKLITGLEGRDEAMYEHLLAKEHEWITFEVESLTANEVDVEAQKVSGEAHGSMTIRGVTRNFAMPVEISVDADKRVLIEGNAPLKLTDYEVPVPSKLGLISMQDEVKVWIALRMRAAGRTHATVGSR